jgi:hypothetical protein
MDLEQLRLSLSYEIDNYVYPYSDQAIGNPKSSERIADQLRQMRSALVTPYWARVTDEPCVIVADDGGSYLLASVPRLKNTFLQ